MICVIKLNTLEKNNNLKFTEVDALLQEFDYLLILLERKDLFIEEYSFLSLILESVAQIEIKCKDLKESKLKNSFIKKEIELKSMLSRLSVNLVN